MRILIIYHFFYPDTVVSARLFSDLAESLVASGHKVTVYTCNQLIRSNKHLPLSEIWNQVQIYRFRRPSLSQSNTIGRIINSFTLQIKWLWSFCFQGKSFDAVIIGTDPQFVWAMFPWIRLINHKVCLIHWVFDLYPEAVIASSAYFIKHLAYLTKPVAMLSYRCCNYIIDIGCEMRNLLQKYNHQVSYFTLTPWALKEPETLPAIDIKTRENLFGKAKLGLLYSGTVGYAHDIVPFIELARECRKRGIDAAFCFAGYGNRFKEQLSVITPEDTNIRLEGFTSEEELEKRLAAADIHMVSLRSNWNGIVVPSKFYGSLASGRPVLFCGPQQNSLADYCKEYKTGFLLSSKTADELQEIIVNKEKLRELKENAFMIYKSTFSKAIICSKWNDLINSIEENRSACSKRSSINIS